MTLYCLKYNKNIFFKPLFTYFVNQQKNDVLITKVVYVCVFSPPSLGFISYKKIIKKIATLLNRVKPPESDHVPFYEKLTASSGDLSKKVMCKCRFYLLIKGNN